MNVLFQTWWEYYQLQNSWQRRSWQCLALWTCRKVSRHKGTGRLLFETSDVSDGRKGRATVEKSHLNMDASRRNCLFWFIGERTSVRIISALLPITSLPSYAEVQFDNSNSRDFLSSFNVIIWLFFWQLLFDWLRTLEKIKMYNFWSNCWHDIWCSCMTKCVCDYH